MKVAVIPVTPFVQNCALIICQATKKAAVVDPGGDLDRIRHAVDQAGATVEKILLTHAHIDHAGGAGELADLLGVDIEGPHPEDQFLIDELPSWARQYGFADARTFTPCRWLDQGDSVTVGRLEFLIRHVPGHTPGHIVFYHQPMKLLVAGDTLFKGSIGRTDFPRGDHETLVAAIRAQILSLPDDVTVLPGHGATTTVGQEKINNPFLGAAAGAAS